MAAEIKMRGIGKKLGARLVSTAIIALSFAGWAQTAAAPDIGHAVDSIFQDLDKPNAPGCAVGALFNDCNR